MIGEKQIAKIEKAVKLHMDDMKNISDFLFKNPELGGEEYIASRYLMNIAENMGWTVTENYCDLDTAFMAELDNGEGPVIGIIIEYDALPGFDPEGRAAHACGHNWISAVGMGVGMIMNDLKGDFCGKLRIIGTPAMENLGCKADMIKNHAFDDVDVVIQSHLEHYTTVYTRFLALDALEFEFKGRSSHAASSPEEGINALDAVQFMFVGMNALKQYLRPDVKIHGIVYRGGESPSIIPDIGVCRYYIRANSRNYLDEIKPKILRCAEGAALMAGAEVKSLYFENPYDNMLGLPLLQDIAIKYINAEGIELSDEKEVETGLSSSDIGNVSHVCPTLYMEFDLEAGDDFHVHNENALKYVNSEFAVKKLRQVSKIMTEVLMELYGDASLVEKIKKEHNRIVRDSVINKS